MNSFINGNNSSSFHLFSVCYILLEFIFGLKLNDFYLLILMNLKIENRNFPILKEYLKFS